MSIALLMGGLGGYLPFAEDPDDGDDDGDDDTSSSVTSRQLVEMDPATGETFPTLVLYLLWVQLEYTLSVTFSFTVSICSSFVRILTSPTGELYMATLDSSFHSYPYSSHSTSSV